MKILVTGVSGYVGGALVPELLESGHEVAGLSRDPPRVSATVPVLGGDIASGEGLTQALDGVEVAYYLAHSLESGNQEGFAARDRRMAQNFVTAAQAAAVRRVIYLGVFDTEDPALRSEHKRCRLEVDEIIRTASPESLSLRASGIIDARNWFWQTMVSVVKRLPVLVLPGTRKARLQPIDGRDVAACLAAAATSEAVAGRAVDIAGPDVVTQGQFLSSIARLMGRRRPLIGLPVKDKRILPRVMAAVSGGDPALLIPLYGSWFTDDVAREDGSALLGVEPHRIEESMRHALAEMGELRASGVGA